MIITKTIKILEFLARITKIMKIKRIPCENHKTLENHRIASEMQEDHENPGVPFEIMKIIAILELQQRITKIMKII